jgi:predicted Zn-dependent protease
MTTEKSSTPSPLIARFEAVLASGKDNALLRFTLGTEYAKVGDFSNAVAHLKAAVTFDPKYSAAWKHLGKAHAAAGAANLAREAFGEGIACATAAGDKQSVREMQVFLRRLPS